MAALVLTGTTTALSVRTGGETSSPSASSLPSLTLGPSPGMRTLQAPVALGAPAQLGSYANPVPLAGNTPVQATLTLGLRDPAGLAAYDAQLHPAPLSAAEVTALWGPSSSSTQALQQRLASEGLQIHAPSNGLVWEVSGPASSFEAAFDTSLVSYTSQAATPVPGSPSSAGLARIAYASPPQLPSDLPGTALSSPDPVGGARPAVLEVPGTPTTPATTSSSSTPSSPSSPSSTSAGCPNAGLTPTKVQTAYNVTPVLASGDQGQGERIGIVDAYDTQEKPWRIQNDLSLFSTCYGLPQTNVSFAWPVAGPPGLNNSTSSGWGLEIALDVEWAHATAPNAAITLVLSPNNAYGLYYGVDWLVATQSVNVVSLSWGEPETGVYNFGPCSYQCNASSDGTLATLEPVIAAAAAEGINVFVASGDCGANGGTLGLTPWYPASDPHAIGVGGTVLNVTSTGDYRSETSWDGTSSFCLNGGGSGGGFSLLPRPAWQSGTGFSRFSNTTRGVPDVALVAAVPLGILYQGNDQYVEGTSDAAPQWAGMDALLKAGSSAGAPGAGYLAPALYNLLRSPRYSLDFHDITTGWNGYGAGKGWDPVTGLGTPNFASLFSDLSQPGVGSFSPPDPGTMLLSAEPQAGVAPLPVQFQAGTLPASGGGGGGAGTGTQYTFYYGDTGPPYQQGNATTTTANVSSHLYPAEAAINFTTPGDGTYMAFATAMGPTDNVTMSVPVAINVGNAGPLEVSASALPGAAGSLTAFHAVAAGGVGPYRFSYFFGDGSFETSWTQDGPQVQHLYAHNGSYLVSVVANDSSFPMRGGSTTLCVTIGGGTPSCPIVPRTLVDDVVPQSTHLTSGGTTMVRVTATFNGLAVSGANVSLSPRLGTIVPAVGTTGPSGSFFANLTVPAVNQSFSAPIFANVSATGYATGLGEALLLVEATTGPSLDPWVRFGQTPAVSGSSVGIAIGGLKAFRGWVASNATVAATVVVNGNLSLSLAGQLDGSGLFATTWNIPVVPAATDAVLTVRLGSPGYTTTPFRFLLPVLPLSGTPTGARAVLSIQPGSMVSMGSVALSVVAYGSTGTTALPITPSEVTVATQPYGPVSFWRSENVSGVRGVGGLFSTPISSVPLGDLLMVNVTNASGGWANGSAAGLVEVQNGYGQIALTFLPSPTVFDTGEKGNLTVQASSQQFGVPLDRVFMLVSPTVGNPSQTQGNSVFGWTDAHGNLTFAYTAPSANQTVLINVQAVGFIYAFSQTNFSLVVHLNAPPCNPCPVPGGGGGSGGGGGNGSGPGTSGSGCPPNCPWTAPYTREAVLGVVIVSLAAALIAMAVVDWRRSRSWPPGSLPIQAGQAGGVLLSGSRPAGSEPPGAHEASPAPVTTAPGPEPAGSPPEPK